MLTTHASGACDAAAFMEGVGKGRLYYGRCGDRNRDNDVKDVRGLLKAVLVRCVVEQNLIFSTQIDITFLVAPRPN